MQTFLVTMQLPSSVQILLQLDPYTVVENRAYTSDDLYLMWLTLTILYHMCFASGPECVCGSVV